MATADPFEELIWRDLRPVLDEEVNGLPEPYRTAVVLCWLEGKPYAEAGRQLGCSKATLSLRLARARHWLRERLERRGVASSLGLFGTLPGQQRALVPVPAELQRATEHAAWLWCEAERLLHPQGERTADAPDPVGGTAAAHGLRLAVAWTKLKAVVAMLVLLGVIAVGVGAVSVWWSADGGAGGGKAAPAPPHGRKTMTDRLQGLTPPK